MNPGDIVILYYSGQNFVYPEANSAASGVIKIKTVYLAHYQQHSRCLMLPHKSPADQYYNFKTIDQNFIKTHGLSERILGRKYVTIMNDAQIIACPHCAPPQRIQ